jgi:hypothetical protein
MSKLATVRGKAPKFERVCKAEADALAQLLAIEMNVKLQFIPFAKDDLAVQLDTGGENEITPILFNGSFSGNSRYFPGN